MIRHLSSILLFVLSTTMAGINLHALPSSDDQISDILSRLDDELEKSSGYMNSRQSKIDSLSQLLKARPSDLKIVEHLAKTYTSFNNDSALAVYSRGYKMAQKINDAQLSRRFKLSRAALLPLAGFFSEALADFESINADSLSEDEKIHYYKAERQMFSFMAAYYHRFPETASEFAARSLNALHNLVLLLPDNSPEYLVNQGEYYYLTGDYVKSETLLQEFMRKVDETDSRYGRATHILADINRQRGSENDRLYYLALSAIADTRSATREMTSLQELGQLMFDRNDIDRAHHYLSQALRNAVACNAETRMIQIAEAMPLIESVHQAELKNSRHRIYVAMALMGIILVVLAVVLVILRRKVRQMHKLQLHLQETNAVKEEYISQFLNLCSIYMDKLKQLSHLVNRKISTGKVDDLYKLTNSGKFIENQSKEFYEVFDNAFIHIYPGFVDGVNTLLREDSQITLQPGELLNTDLRILAFMRLGIEDSNRIAQILNYSVNTIYTYRNKLKNRAINRDTFERDLMSLS